LTQLEKPTQRNAKPAVVRFFYSLSVEKNLKCRKKVENGLSKIKGLQGKSGFSTFSTGHFKKKKNSINSTKKE
jgi:hypothetical protein